uniref:exodeoxyribonuclease III n=1 Tax=Nothobranchius furzeri TaxID=105023 RepID=A0A8C6PR15_NOTFU
MSYVKLEESIMSYLSQSETHTCPTDCKLFSLKEKCMPVSFLFKCHNCFNVKTKFSTPVCCCSNQKVSPVRGLKKFIELKQVMNRLRQQGKIIFFQETHLIKEHVIRVSRRWPGWVFSASASSNARGVVTLIHRSIPFKLVNEIGDKFGRFIIIECEISSVKINLVNIDGPNNDNPEFFRQLFMTLATLLGHFIIGGDFNCTLQPNLDRSTGIDMSHSNIRKEILQLIKDFNLVDIWRSKNLTQQSYSCYSGASRSFSRIDYFLISSDLISITTECWYDSILISDHAPHSFLLRFTNSIICPNQWRLQPIWLRDPGFIEFIGEQIDLYFDKKYCSNICLNKVGSF